jgi:hypothetical protein
MKPKEVVMSVDGLRKLRQEWETTGADLLTTKAPVGMMLLDTCEAIGLSSDETAEVLGPGLYGQTIS